MTGVDEGQPIDTDQSLPELETGRYLYCLVRAAEDDDFETTGIADEPVSLVSIDGLGAVVHTCSSVYDSADLAEIRRWLVRHQSVVDDAAEQFGTPLPFQFDTILRGDDAAVRDWLRSERERLIEPLAALADHWEYRVDVVRTEPIEPAQLIDSDDRLASLHAEIDDADDGTAFLLEKQYDRRLAELEDQRRAAITGDLQDRLADEAREVHELERDPAASLSDTDHDRETVCRLTLLAHKDREEAIGAVLDEIAAEPDLQVQFTGPWPPYTFAPELGDDE